MIQLRHSRSDSRVSDRGYSFLESTGASPSSLPSRVTLLNGALAAWSSTPDPATRGHPPEVLRSGGVSHRGHDAGDQQQQTNDSRHPQHCTGQLSTYSIKIPLTLFKSRRKAHLFSSVYAS